MVVAMDVNFYATGPSKVEILTIGTEGAGHLMNVGVIVRHFGLDLDQLHSASMEEKMAMNS